MESYRTQDSSAEKAYMCNLCGESFSQSQSLNKHKKSHTGDKDYVCVICNKSFINKYNLTTHIKTPTGDKGLSSFP